jgi:hypothetical protein
MMKKLVILVTCTIILACTLVACESSPPAPQRSFTTFDLLISSELLGLHWNVTADPKRFPASRFGYSESLETSEVEIQSDVSSVIHIVGLFASETSTKNAYDDHIYSRDQIRPYKLIFKPVTDLDYTSPLADEFQILCGSPDNIIEKGVYCTVEARYQEFLSVVLYRNNRPNRALIDLKVIAEAVDERMEEFLDK